VSGKADPVVPEKASLEGLLQGFHNSDLVSVQGKLLYHSLEQMKTSDSSDATPNRKILTLQDGAHIFTVEAPDTGQFASLTSIPIGSTLAVSGICSLQTGEGGRIVAAHILLRDPLDISILIQPPWWTPGRLLTGLGILLAISSIGAIWTLMILRKNSALKSSIAEKVEAQEELQKANDMLETRVEERTKQLKVEISARKEAEVQFNATVAERTRIAQELHDTLLQGFTGIGLKLEALNNTLPGSLAAEKAQLQKILEQSDEYVDEARQAVWELRSPSLEKNGDFSKAVMKVSERALQGTDIRLQFATFGEACKPAPPVEDNFLRICEEAVTNAVKHANPTLVEVKLEYTPDELRLRIRDDGRGFDPKGPKAFKNGHFGLVGIRERVKAVDGDLSLKSQPGHGTEILVSVHRLTK
jgi:signal transduction histidine kinase